MPNNDLERLELPSDLAGFESTRYTFYGSDFAKSMGLKLFPLLAEEYWFEFEGDELDELRREAVMLYEHVIETEVGGYWAFRINNILNAIDAARHFDGLVRIW
ncbi:hypothetical protein [Lysobacter brunescens]